MAETIDTRVALLEQIARNIDERLARSDRRFDRLDDQFNTVHAQLQSIRDEHHRDLKWLIGVWVANTIGLLGFLVALAAIIAHHPK